MAHPSGLTQDNEETAVLGRETRGPRAPTRRRYAVWKAWFLTLAAATAGAPVAAQDKGELGPDVVRPAADSSAVTMPSASTGEEASFFYRDVPGSNQYVGPLDVLLNKAFNMSQATNRTQYIFDARYAVDHVVGSLLHPVASIERSGGWGAFFSEQILPVGALKWIGSGFDWEAADNMAWYPNYMGHFVEGGITSRRLAEKLRSQGVPWPGFVAGTVTMAAAMTNEAYTHADLSEGTGETVADLYVFDLGGVLLFSLDPVARFFSEKLHATVWTGQASLTIYPDDVHLANNANNLVFKLPLPFTDDVSVFFRTAVGSHLGASVHLAGGYDLSIGVGADTSRQKIDPVTGHETVDIRPSGSVWLDRGGSVLGYMYWSTVDRRTFSLNVFPSVLLPNVGAWLAVTREGAVELGFTHRSALGLGLGTGW